MDADEQECEDTEIIQIISYSNSFELKLEYWSKLEMKKFSPCSGLHLKSC